jgi:hypothetical protein
MRYGMRRLWLAAALFCGCAAAQVCDPPKLIGPYGFQLSGITTISGEEKPTTSVGRLVFDGHGGLSGRSSAMFSGYLLGNPVTGSYELKTDCSLTWKLQDDSGNYQNFGGKISSDLLRAQFRQTDPGGPHQGVLQRTPEKCSDQDLRTRYTYTVSGSTTPMIEGEKRRTVSAKGTLDVARNGTFSVDSDCTVTFDLAVLRPDQLLDTIKMRGILVDGGREILAIETDAGAMVAGRFSAN